MSFVIAKQKRRKKKEKKRKKEEKIGHQAHKNIFKFIRIAFW